MSSKRHLNCTHIVIFCQSVRHILVVVVVRTFIAWRRARHFKYTDTLAPSSIWTLTVLLMICKSCVGSILHMLLRYFDSFCFHFHFPFRCFFRCSGGSDTLLSEIWFLFLYASENPANTGFLCWLLTDWVRDPHKCDANNFPSFIQYCSLKSLQFNSIQFNLIVHRVRSQVDSKLICGRFINIISNLSFGIILQLHFQQGNKFHIIFEWLSVCLHFFFSKFSLEIIYFYHRFCIWFGWIFVSLNSKCQNSNDGCRCHVQ